MLKKPTSLYELPFFQAALLKLRATAFCRGKITYGSILESKVPYLETKEHKPLMNKEIYHFYAILNTLRTALQLYSSTISWK